MPDLKSRPDLQTEQFSDAVSGRRPSGLDQRITQRRWLLPVVALWAFLLLPLLLASLARPFGWWDSFTYWTVLHFFYPVSWANLLPGYFAALNNSYVIRPTASLIYDILLLTLGPEFWLWYLLKWAAKFATIWLAVRILDALGVRRLVQLAVVAFLLFHTSSYQLMVTSLDGTVALAILGLLLLLLRAERPFDLTALHPRQYTLFVLGCVLTVGLKEVAFLLTALLLGMSLLISRRLSWRYAPILLLLAGWTWLLFRASGRVSTLTRAEFLQRVMEYTGRLAPDSPLHLLSIVIGVLLVLSVVAAIRGGSLRLKATLAYSFGGAVIVLLFSAVAPVADRYVIPAVFLLALPIGVAANAYVRSRASLVSFLFVYPLLTAADHYQQELAYQQWFYEFSEVLQHADAKASQGYRLAMAGDGSDPGLEMENTVRFFFGEPGARYYSRTPRELASISEGWPQQQFVFLTALTLDQLHQKYPQADLSRLIKVEYGTKGDYGTLERLARLYTRVDALLGNTHKPRVDLGAPWPSQTPWLYLYTFDQANKPAPPVVLESNENVTKSRSYHIVAPETEQRFVATRQEYRGWKTMITPAAVRSRLRMDGELRLMKGALALGIVNEKAEHIWGMHLRPSDGWQPLPKMPVLEFPPNHVYYYFFLSANEDTEFVLKNFRLLGATAVEPIPRHRRFGAMMW